MTISWNLISPALVQRGYCVFALGYGDRATGRIQRSARQLRRFIGKVRAATGGHKVAIVGHSQGGIMPRYLIKFLGGTKSISELVGLAPSNHGTTTPFARPVGEQFSCAACIQQIAGSRFLRRLNRGDETPAASRTRRSRRTRRGGDSLHVRLPRPRAADHQRPAPAQVPARSRRSQRDPLRSGGAPVGGERARSSGPRQPSLQARLRLAAPQLSPLSQRRGFTTSIVWSCSSVVPASRRAGITSSKMSVKLQLCTAPASRSPREASAENQSNVAQ
jgi:pimeloyl-ACP methyl ester carboxylesterase